MPVDERPRFSPYYERTFSERISDWMTRRFYFIAPYQSFRDLLFSLKKIALGLIRTISACLMLIMLVFTVIPFLLLKCLFYKQIRGGGFRSMLTFYFYYKFLFLLVKFYSGIRAVAEIIFIPIRCLMTLFYMVVLFIRETIRLINQLRGVEHTHEAETFHRPDDVDYYDYLERLIKKKIQVLCHLPNASFQQDSSSSNQLTKILGNNDEQQHFIQSFLKKYADVFFTTRDTFKDLFIDVKQMLFGLRDGVLGAILIVFSLLLYPVNILLACFSYKNKEQFFQKIKKINFLLVEALTFNGCLCLSGLIGIAYLLVLPCKLCILMGKKIAQGVESLWNILRDWHKLEPPTETSEESLDASQLHPMRDLTHDEWVASILDSPPVSPHCTRPTSRGLSAGSRQSSFEAGSCGQAAGP